MNIDASMFQVLKGQWDQLDQTGTMVKMEQPAPKEILVIWDPQELGDLRELKDQSVLRDTKECKAHQADKVKEETMDLLELRDSQDPMDSRVHKVPWDPLELRDKLAQMVTKEKLVMPDPQEFRDQEDLKDTKVLRETKELLEKQEFKENLEKLDHKALQERKVMLESKDHQEQPE